MRYVFIINPTAGKGNGTSIIPEIEKTLEGKDYKIYVTEKSAEGTEIARKEAESGEEIRMFACGGEGTGFEVINGIVGFGNVAFGVVPCGSANDFLKSFGNKEHFFDIAAQVAGEEKEIDLIKANEYYCINCCSVGMDAIVADGMRLFKRLPLISGSVAYKLSLLKTFLGKIGIKLKITIDGVQTAARDYLFAVCANGPIYGGGFKAAPNAVPFDGILDYVVINPVSKLKIPSLVKVYEQGRHEGLDICSMGKCRSMEIESEALMPVNLDGELVHLKKVEFSIAEKALRFIIPQGNC
ncbi:MAG: diacylglycerol kinase family lipid kinase [Clostridia bacterium]|nr:diacylglycerol kinase family lipid kinase [Clostridia bacterium]